MILTGFRLETATGTMEYLTLQKLWEHDAGGAISSDIACGDIDRDGNDEFVVTTDGSRMLAFSREGKKLWETSFGGTPLLGTKMSRASPIIADLPSGPTILMGSPDQGLFALDGKGRVKFSFTDCGAVLSTPAIGDINGDFLPEIVFGSTDGSLYILDSYGNLTFKKDMGYPIESRIAILSLQGKKHVVFGATDGKLHALRGDGTKSWSFQTGGAIVGAPAIMGVVGNESVVVGSTDSFIYSMSAVGDLLWKRKTGGAIISDAAPYPQKGQDGVAMGVCSRKENMLVITGKEGKESIRSNHWVSHAPAIGHDRSLVFGSYDHHLYVVSPEKKGGRKTLSFDTKGPIIGRPAISRDGLVVAGNRDGRIVCLKRDSPSVAGID